MQGSEDPGDRLPNAAADHPGLDFGEQPDRIRCSTLTGRQASTVGDSRVKAEAISATTLALYKGLPTGKPRSILPEVPMISENGHLVAAW